MQEVASDGRFSGINDARGRRGWIHIDPAVAECEGARGDTGAR